MHSRHPRVSIRGIDVSNEIHCLNQDLDYRLPITQHEKCIIYLSSDRNQTIHGVQNFINVKQQQQQQQEQQQKDPKRRYDNCSVIVASKNLPSSSNSTPNLAFSTIREHGPFAGLGFFQDLEVASHARNAFIGHEKRSSSRLLLELIEYDRCIEKEGVDTGQTRKQQQQQQQQLPKLHTCWLPHNGRPSVLRKTVSANKDKVYMAG